MGDRFKFRARRIDNNEFVYGFLCFVIRDVCRIYCNEEDKFYDCSTKTLGQCTGVQDKNGIFIYEGDIVSTRVELDDDYKQIIGQILWDRLEWKVKTKKFGNISLDVCGLFANGLEMPKQCNLTEVISNMHKNLEEKCFRLEVGKLYKTRSGEKAICLYIDNNRKGDTHIYKMYRIGQAKHYWVDSRGNKDCGFYLDSDIVDYWKE